MELMNNITGEYRSSPEEMTKSASIWNILIKGPFKYLNDRFPYPYIYLNLWNQYPFIYLEPEKGTPFARSLPV